MSNRAEWSKVIAATIAQWEDAFVTRAVFGTHDPVPIARAVEAFCQRELGSDIDAYLFFEESIGVVSGVTLRDGRRVVVKAHPPSRDHAALAAVQRVQAHLAGRGYPCPRPLAGPAPLAQGVAVAEELVDDGVYRDAHEPAVRRAMAELLARLVAETRALADLPGLPRRLGAAGGLTALRSAGRDIEGLWPRPHSKLFDFEATAAGADWIDDLASAARRALATAAGESVIGHTDWSIKHFRFQGDAVRVIYDWDSLAVDRETTLVGEAARGFTMTWHMPVRLIPSREEALAFVGAYETARGAPFNAVEREAMAAAATYALAYTARCEHCRDARPGNYPPGSAREALAQHGADFLRPARA